MKLLTSLYYISAPTGKEFEMVNYIDEYLKGLGVDTYRDKSNNLYATKGVSETYPCVIAHTDEVHKRKPKSYVVYDLDGMIIGVDNKKKDYVGIGADDKNGIWVALKCFERFDVMKAAFFVSEEIGCIGSSSADMEFFDDCRFVLQCDRRNGDDFVTSICGIELCSKEFVQDCNLNIFGYKETTGMLTDVMTLKENGLEVSCVNMSCGYYNPHTNTEYTNFEELENCLGLVSYIIENCTDVYKHEYNYVSKYKGLAGYSGYGTLSNNNDIYGYGYSSLSKSSANTKTDDSDNDSDAGTYNSQYLHLVEFISDTACETNTKTPRYTIDEWWEFMCDEYPLLNYADFECAFYDVYGECVYTDRY